MKIKLFVAGLLAVNMAWAHPPAEEGKTIFASRCASCHNVNKILTGPALAGVHERHTLDWIVNFVRSSQSVIKSGDKEAVALFEKFNKIPMPDHPDLGKDDVQNIIEFIKEESKNAGVDKAPFSKPLKMKPMYKPISIDDYGFFIAYLAVVAILILALLFAVQLKQYEREMHGKN
jgi:cytochrome c551/c552